MLPRAAVGVLVQVGLERVELAGPRSLPAAVGEFLPGGGAVEPLDGVQAPAQVAGDLAQAPPFGAQLVDQGVVPPGAFGVLPGGVGLRGGVQVPAAPVLVRPRRAEAPARPGRRGGRRRTSRRLWRGSATGGTGRRPGPRPVPRCGPRRRTSPRGPGRSPRRPGARSASPRAAGRRGLRGGPAARRSRMSMSSVP